VIASGLWLLRSGRPSSRILVFAGAALTFWVLAGANFTPGRAPISSRYQLIDAVLLLLVAAELLRGLRLRGLPAALVVALALIALVSNLVALGHGYRFMREQSAYIKADLGALEIARDRAPAALSLAAVGRNPYMTWITAGRYFSATDAHGSPPTYSPAQIAAAPAAQRQAADSVLVGAYGMFARPARAVRAGPGCRRLAPRPDGNHPEAGLRSGGALVTDLGRSALIVGVRRFAPPGMSLPVGLLAAGSTVRVPLVRDALRPPWLLTARGSSPVRVCPA
jgi:hypothetical protein